jgi:kynureninase
MAPVLLSLELFDEVGIAALRAKSKRLTGYLEMQLDAVSDGRSFELITPRDPERRGAQLSLRIVGLDAGKVSTALRREHGVYADARQPDVIRLAPAPLYCTYQDCWRAARALAEVLDRG